MANGADKFSINKGKAGAVILLAIYFLWGALHPDKWQFLDYVNLLIHEAGHLIFSFGGEFVMIAGGTIMQIIVPFLFVGYFYFDRQIFSSIVAMFWLGESIINASHYAADAVSMSLPLLGGEGVIHDWNYMLTHLGLLPYTSFIAHVIQGVGILVILAGAVLGLLDSYRANKQDPVYVHYKASL